MAIASHEYIPITWETFEEKYKPIQNHISNREEFNGWLFETYEDDLEHIHNVKEGNRLPLTEKNVWTIMSGDEYSVMISNGYHFVNRMGYVITEIPWNEGETIDVLDDDDKETDEEQEDDYETTDKSEGGY